MCEELHRRCGRSPGRATDYTMKRRRSRCRARTDRLGGQMTAMPSRHSPRAGRLGALAHALCRRRARDAPRLNGGSASASRHRAPGRRLRAALARTFLVVLASVAGNSPRRAWPRRGIALVLDGHARARQTIPVRRGHRRPPRPRPLGTVPDRAPSDLLVDGLRARGHRNACHTVVPFRCRRFWCFSPARRSACTSKTACS